MAADAAEAAGQAAAAAGEAAAAAGGQVAEEAAKQPDSDWFTPFVEFNAGVIDGIDSVIEEKLKIPNSFGWAIIIYTFLIKVLTYPLNQSSLRSNAMMQLIQPKVKQIQAKYANDSETMNRMMLRLYDDIGVSPIGGCLPALAQFPIFISLYRAINLLATKNVRFTEPFLFIPSLAGPVDVGKPTLDWLVKSQFEDHFEPLIGWENAAKYLVLPISLVFTQFITSKASNPAGTQQQGPAAAILNFFPLIIGYTTMVSPAGLGLYWLTNNLLTTAQTQLIRNQLGEEFPEYRKMMDGTAAKEAEEKKNRLEEARKEESAAVPVGLGKGFAGGRVMASSAVEDAKPDISDIEEKVREDIEGEEPKLVSAPAGRKAGTNRERERRQAAMGRVKKNRTKRRR